MRTFPCSETERVNELKFCDGKVDCSNSVDEPSGCPSGTQAHYAIISTVLTVFVSI